MDDFLKAGLVYVPAWVIGRMLCHFEWTDPFIVGWIVASVAVCVRWDMAENTSTDTHT